MTASIEIDNQILQEWIVTQMDPKAIEQELKALGYDEGKVSAYLKAYRKAKHARRQFIGFMVTGLGAVLGFISCVLSLVNPIPELYNLILFGLTSVAILLIVAGMYLVFE